MDWAKGYKAIYYAMAVNPKTWYDTEQIPIISGSISRENTGLRSSAEFTSDSDGFNERLIRIYIDAVQGGDIEHTAIFTGYAISPSIDINGTLKSQKYTCYSILKPADDILLDRGWYAPINTNAGNMIRDLLSVTKAPFEIEGDAKTLENYIVAESGETRLTMVDKILKAINYELVVNGNGEILIRPKKEKADAVFSATNDIVEPQFSITQDWYDVPNVLRVVMDDVSAIARDDSERSIYSTVNRGREIWAEEASADIANGDTLAEYAKRRLKEAQMVGTEASYTRRFVPDIYVNDIVELRYESLNGKYRVKSQKINLSHNLTTSETVERIDTDIQITAVTRPRAIFVMPDDVIFTMPYIVTAPIARSLSNG